MHVIIAIFLTMYINEIHNTFYISYSSIVTTDGAAFNHYVIGILRCLGKRFKTKK